MKDYELSKRKEYLISFIKDNIKNYSKKELAYKSGLSERCIEYIIEGKRKPMYETLFALIKAMDYEIDLFVTMKGF